MLTKSNLGMISRGISGCWTEGVMISRLFTTGIRKKIVTVTPPAWEKMAAILKMMDSPHGMLFSASNGGCNGFNYDLSVLNEKTLGNLNRGKMEPSFIEHNNTRLYVDPLSEMLLIGTTIDYVSEDPGSGLFESKFVFTPDENMATSCGCGVSFSPR